MSPFPRPPPPPVLGGSIDPPPPPKLKSLKLKALLPQRSPAQLVNLPPAVLQQHNRFGPDSSTRYTIKLGSGHAIATEFSPVLQQCSRKGATPVGHRPCTVHKLQGPDGSGTSISHHAQRHAHRTRQNPAMAHDLQVKCWQSSSSHTQGTAREREGPGNRCRRGGAERRRSACRNQASPAAGLAPATPQDTDTTERRLRNVIQRNRVQGSS